MTTKLFVDVEPGEIFEANWGLGDEPQMYLKLSEQKAVNLNTYIAIAPREQQEMVVVKPYKIEIYLWNGGLRPSKR